MKNKFKKSVFLLSSLMMLSVGAGIISGVDSHVDTAEAADASAKYDCSAALSTSGTKLDDFITIKVSQTNTYKSPVRIYKNTVVTFSGTDSVLIKSIEITASSGKYYTALTGGTWSATVTNTGASTKGIFNLSTPAQTISYTASSAQTRWSSIVVNYTTGDSGDIDSGTVSINGDSSCQVGDELKYEVSLNNISGTINWTSSDEEVATVNDGVVTSIAMGTTTITADVNGVKDSIELKVYPAENSQITIADALEVCKLTGESESPYSYTVFGKVSSIDTEYNSQYNNITITLKDDTGSISCYRLSGGEKLTVGDEIYVTGKLVNYVGNNSQFIAASTFVYEEYDALVTPTEVKLDKENGLIYWDSVDNASGYKLYVLDENANEVINEENYNGTSYDVSIFGNGEYTGTIQVLGNNNYPNGEEVDFTFELNQDISSQISAIKTQSSLGFSYDVTEGNQQSSTITFDDISKRTSYSTEQQIWEENGLTVTNNKASSTSNVGDYSKPARFYKSTTVKIESSNPFTKIVFTANNASYATALNSSITGGSVNDKVVTVEFAEAVTEYEFTATGGQIRMDSITVESGGKDTYTFDNIRIRFAANVTEGLYEELNLATAEVGFNVTDGTKTHNIDCTGKFESDGQGNYFIICSIWNIPTGVEFTAQAYFVIGDDTYYAQETSYSVKSITTAYLSGNIVTLNSETKALLEAFNAYINA